MSRDKFIAAAEVVNKWDEWDAQASQLAQINQDDRFWFEEMRACVFGEFAPVFDDYDAQLAAVTKERDELWAALNTIKLKAEFNGHKEIVALAAAALEQGDSA